LKGGLHDCLTRTNGFVDAVTNEEIFSAMSLFSGNEKIDLDPAAGVALASLLKFSKMQQPSSDTTILLNITGGGRARYSENFSVFPLLPDLSIPSSDVGDPALARRLVDLFH
jgi:cysteate synthase